VAELLSSNAEKGKTQFKFNLKRAAGQPLPELLKLFAQAAYTLSPPLQKDILKLQGATHFAELLLRETDLILKPTGFLDLDEVKALLTYDAAERAFHARPLDFFTIHRFLENKGYLVVSHVRQNFKMPSELRATLRLDMALRDYQEEALHRWFGAKCRGVVVLPTGSGKTIVALEAIRRLALNTLIVVPTIDLLSQWQDALKTSLHLSEVGVLGGGSKSVSPVTVSTYDSASLRAADLADAFGLLIFDEVHHLPSPNYRLAAELSVAANRLGLTATPERYDELHQDLDRLVGPIVYRVAPRVLERGGYLAPYRIQTIQVNLTPEEQVEYDAHMSIFRVYVQKLAQVEPSWDFNSLVEHAFFDKAARDALSNLEKARRIALEASGKIEYVEKLLTQYRDAKVIIFSRYTRIVETLSDLLGIPLITHKTKAAERERILTGFKAGLYTKIATGQVLDEGVDVPDASVGIVISGSGSQRQFVQRLGRLLRPQKQEAILVELVTGGTIEDGLAQRRRAERSEDARVSAAPRDEENEVD
jgi:superfamily II DNA or RNA helicase